jgi:molecular chaperone DnaK
VTDHTIVSKGVGIDLGTTNSAVAVMDRTDSDIVIHRDPISRSRTTPSCVWKDPKSGELVVGRMAFKRAGSTPPPIRSVKRLMGRSTTVRLTDEDVTPEQVSATILGEMKRQIEQDISAWDTPTTSWIVDRAIVTVPAYFDHPSIEATRKAAEQVGLDVLDLLHEPTAAACYHCWRTKTEDGTFLVYDLGGGTFDVSVVRYTAGAFAVLGISGNTRLGGDDIDIAVASHLQEQLIRDGYAFELDPENDPEDRIRFSQLRFLAEGIKKSLSVQTEFMVSDAGTMRDKNGENVIVETMWERSDFEALARPIVERTIPYCDEAIKLATARAGVTLADVDQIILAGGSTHIPLVREMVTRELCASADAPTNRPVRARCAEPVYEKVDTIVALGAAIRAAEVGGLATYDTKRTIRVSFRGTGSSQATTTSIGGKVEALSSDLTLADCRIRLVSEDYEDETELRAGGSFAFTNVPLQPQAETFFTFEVSDASGDVIARAGRPIDQNPDVPSPGFEGRTAQFAKSVLLEVDRGGEPYHKELIPALAQLPTSADFTFSHPGDTELVLFSLYQRRHKIQEIEVPVPAATPRGTPIEFNVHVDDRALITVKGTIGGIEFDAKVMTPPDRNVPAPDEVERLERAFRDAIGYLATGTRAVAEVKWQMGKTSFDAAMARGDKAQAVHEFEELEALVAEISDVGTPLKPPKPQLDQLVRECRQLNDYLRPRASAAGVSHDHAEIAKAIDAQAVQGERAFQSSDQRSYGQVFEMLERIHEHLEALVANLAPSPSASSRSLAETARAKLEAARTATTRVLRLAEAKDRTDAQAEVKAIQGQLAELGRDLGRDPQHVLTKSDQFHARLEQLYNTLPDRPSSQGGKRPEDLS